VRAGLQIERGICHAASWDEGRRRRNPIVGRHLDRVNLTTWTGRNLNQFPIIDLWFYQLTSKTGTCFCVKAQQIILVDN
jgi:hypothetical protein